MPVDTLWCFWVSVGFFALSGYVWDELHPVDWLQLLNNVITFWGYPAAPPSPPLCHQVITCHLLADHPPFPPTDDVIYEQPLLTVSSLWPKSLIIILCCWGGWWLAKSELSTMTVWADYPNSWLVRPWRSSAKDLSLSRSPLWTFDEYVNSWCFM